MTKQNLSGIIDSALATIGLTTNAKTGEFKWNVNLNDVETQIAVEDAGGSPTISLYFAILQLPPKNRAECIEELMRAHFHMQSKYTLYNEFILQIVDVQHTQLMTADIFSELLSMYVQHAAALRNDLFQKYFG